MNDWQGAFPFICCSCCVSGTKKICASIPWRAYYKATWLWYKWRCSQWWSGSSLLLFQPALELPCFVSDVDWCRSRSFLVTWHQNAAVPDRNFNQNTGWLWNIVTEPREFGHHLNLNFVAGATLGRKRTTWVRFQRICWGVWHRSFNCNWPWVWCEVWTRRSWAKTRSRLCCRPPRALGSHSPPEKNLYRRRNSGRWVTLFRVFCRLSLKWFIYFRPSITVLSQPKSVPSPPPRRGFVPMKNNVAGTGPTVFWLTHKILGSFPQDIFQNLKKDIDTNTCIHLSTNQVRTLIEANERQSHDTHDTSRTCDGTQGTSAGGDNAASDNAESKCEAVVFTCGHHYTRASFLQSVVPSFYANLSQAPNNLPQTASLLTSYYRRDGELPLACPRCVLSTLQSSQWFRQKQQLANFVLLSIRPAFVINRLSLHLVPFTFLYLPRWSYEKDNFSFVILFVGCGQWFRVKCVILVLFQETAVV